MDDEEIQDYIEHHTLHGAQARLNRELQQMRSTILRELLCKFGWHRYAFHHRAPLGGRYWTRYDRCKRCGEMTARGERL